jgi:hypothetical protein
MKKISNFFGLVVSFGLSISFVIFSFNSCSPEKPVRNERAVQWKLNVGQQTYFWQGFYPDQLTNGSALVAKTDNIPFILTLSRLNIKKSFQVYLPEASSGTFIINASDTLNRQFNLIDDNNLTHSSKWGGEITIVISELASKANGPVAGYCYGSIGRNPANGGGTLSINGSFEAIKNF